DLLALGRTYSPCPALAVEAAACRLADPSCRLAHPLLDRAGDRADQASALCAATLPGAGNHARLLGFDGNTYDGAAWPDHERRADCHSRRRAGGACPASAPGAEHRRRRAADREPAGPDPVAYFLACHPAWTRGRSSTASGGECGITGPYLRADL